VTVGWQNLLVTMWHLPHDFHLAPSACLSVLQYTIVLWFRKKYRSWPLYKCGLQTCSRLG